MYSIAQRLGKNYVERNLIELPGWFSIVSTQEEYIKNKFFIHETIFSQEDNEVKICLATLEALYRTKVDYKIFFDFFKTINLLVANPLSKAVFNLKIKPLYHIFKELPLIVFNEQTCKELAIATPFFPSAFDIDKITTKQLQNITKNISLLRQLIRSE